MKRFLLLLVILLAGCGSSATILSWKPTIVIVKDNDVAGPDKKGGTINAIASPTQPTTISDITGLPTP